MAESTTTSAPSRRQTNKSRTKRELQQAALKLFAKQGYDETTTEEIAEQAHVSPRTFFRYFSTKESVLFVGEEGWVERLTSTFLSQPAALSDIEALTAALVALASGFTESRKSQLLYEKAVRTSATLRGRVHEHQLHDISMLAAAIATRRKLSEVDESCILAASIALITHRRALDRWLAGPASADPCAAIRYHFDLLGDLLEPKRTASRRR